MNKEKFRRFGWAIYLLVFSFAVILFLIGSYAVTEGTVHALVLNLSSEFLGVVSIFFLVNQLFLWNPESERQERFSQQFNDLARLLQDISTQLRDTFTAQEIVEQYSTSGEWALALAARVLSAKRVKDVSWANEAKLRHRWSEADEIAHRHCDAIISQVLRTRGDIIFEEICVLSNDRLNRKIQDLESEDATAYSFAYFESIPERSLSRIGGFMVLDAGTDRGEVFFASADSTMWVKAAHPSIVNYFSNYFDSLWHQAETWGQILKRGPELDRAKFQKLIRKYSTDTSDDIADGA